MLSKSDLKKIKEETKTFFDKMGFGAEFELLAREAAKGEAPTLCLKVRMENPEPLIGRGGRTLFYLQRLLAVVLKRKIQAEFFLDLDINDYRAKKTEYLKDLAQRVADRVVLTRQEKVLNAMPPFERRIIHLELAERGDVTSESLGREPERRVVIKPYP